MPANGGPLRLLGDVPLAAGGFVQSCRFHPGSGLMSYFATRDGVGNVFAQAMSGGPERQLTHFGRDGAPQLFSGAWSRDGGLAVSRGFTTSDVVLIAGKPGNR